MIRRVKNLFAKIRRINPVSFTLKSKPYKRARIFVRRRPFTSFLVSLLILLLIIMVGRVVTGLGLKEEVSEPVAKNVKTFRVGEIPRVTLQAQVEQKGVVQIVAQTPGIVQKVHVKEGEDVKSGQLLISLSTNYQGENASAVQLSIAGAQYKSTKETFETQKDIVRKQKELAETNSDNTEELRKISENSLNNSRSLINLNNEITKTLDSQIIALESTGGTEVEILAAKQQKAQVQAGINQLAVAIENTEFQVDKDNPPTSLSNLQKEITLKQLDIQDKMLDLNKQVSSLQYSLALIQASLMRPAAPFKGTVERINVSAGKLVNPGNVLATIKSDNPSAQITVLAPKDIAGNVSRIEPSIIHIESSSISAVPSYVSTVATEGQLYTIIYNLPESVSLEVTDGGFIPLEIPIGYVGSSAKPFIPIDSIFQSQNNSYVYVVKNGEAATREILIGNVFGGFVEVEKGITADDEIILTRNVVAGDKVTTN